MKARFQSLDSKQITPVQVDKLAKLAGWASVVSTLIALVAGIMGLVSKVKLDERGAGQ
ncbi:MAG: hypothetical protein ACXW4E_08010 [Anaerolineales bacterium]